MFEFSMRLFYNRKNHLEFFKSLQRVGNVFRHYDNLAFLKNVRNSADCNFSLSVQNLNHRVTRSGMACNRLAFVECHYSYSNARLLGKRHAGNFSVFILNKIFKNERFCVLNIFNQFFFHIFLDFYGFLSFKEKSA